MHPCSKCGKDSKEGGSHVEDHECDESTHEHANGTVDKNSYLSKNQYKRLKTKLKKQKINVVFNSSHTVLTESMVKLLNRGLKFSVLPLKLDITQVLTDFKRFERTMVWKEYWFGKDKEPYVLPIVKQKKYNFPRNHKAPKGLQNYLAAIKSEIADTMNRHRVKSNITDEEKDALKKLI